MSPCASELHTGLGWCSKEVLTSESLSVRIFRMRGKTQVHVAAQQMHHNLEGTQNCTVTGHVWVTADINRLVITTQ